MPPEKINIINVKKRSAEIEWTEPVFLHEKTRGYKVKKQLLWYIIYTYILLYTYLIEDFPIWHHYCNSKPSRSNNYKNLSLLFYIHKYQHIWNILQ